MGALQKEGNSVKVLLTFISPRPRSTVYGTAESLQVSSFRSRHHSNALNQDGNVLLSDDPNRRPHQVGDSVPIYVQSVWPPNSLRIEDGLKRLGYLDERHLTVSGPDLVKDTSRIARVVAAHVCHNGRRLRVRSFVLDALLRLAAREDVSGFVLNTHSNGTIVGLDVVQELPPFAAEKIRAIITAGSPIRKNVVPFCWGIHKSTRPQTKI